MSAVALRNGVNANVVFGWRRLHRTGLLVKQRDVAPRLLPVKLTMPTLTPSERASLPAAKTMKHPAAPIPSYLERAGAAFSDTGISGFLSGHNRRTIHATTKTQPFGEVQGPSGA